MAAAAPNPEDASRNSGGPSTASALAGDGESEEAEEFASATHCSELSRRQNEQRKLGLFCDVTLAFSSAPGAANSFEFSAHRSVLSAATDYFTPLLGGQFSESVTRRVEMKEWSSEAGLDQETVESVIQFMYTGEIRVSTANVHEVLELADSIVAMFDCKYTLGIIDAVRIWALHAPSEQASLDIKDVV
ncbi:hypothetical protein M9458_025260 [Cirrhinus mrigala]|uniref:BTB domain-containing protein n=1 Tax=Cirrhinus mrigala TaxID=683832 RepID=A0ABD0Q0J8_CIRMR